MTASYDYHIGVDYHQSYSHLVVQDSSGKTLESTYVIIEEVELDNWGWGGLPAAQYRAQRAAAARS